MAAGVFLPASNFNVLSERASAANALEAGGI
jgi:hypothetical protein